MDKLLTEREAAELLGYSRHTLRQSRCSGLLAGVHRPNYVVQGKRTVRYKESDLEGWITQASVNRKVDSYH